MKKSKTLPASLVKKMVPDLLRVGTPPNRFWVTQGHAFETLTQVVDSIRPAEEGRKIELKSVPFEGLRLSELRELYATAIKHGPQDFANSCYVHITERLK